MPKIFQEIAEPFISSLSTDVPWNIYLHREEMFKEQIEAIRPKGRTISVDTFHLEMTPGEIKAKFVDDENKRVASIIIPKPETESQQREVAKDVAMSVVETLEFLEGSQIRLDDKFRGKGVQQFKQHLRYGAKPEPELLNKLTTFLSTHYKVGNTVGVRFTRPDEGSWQCRLWYRCENLLGEDIRLFNQSGKLAMHRIN